MEHLVGYAKRDLIVPAEPEVADLPAANAAAAAWCAEVNAAVHSEICAVPAERLEQERELLGALPSLRPEIGARPTSRKVDKLSCVRFGSARYSVPEPAHRHHRADHRARRPGADRSSRSPARSSPSTRWSRPVRPASPTSITARPGRTSHAARRGPGPPRRSSSWPSARSAGVPDRRRRGRGRQPGPGDRRDPHPAGRARRRRAARRAGTGRASSAGGAPMTCARSWPRPAPRPRPARPGRRWCSPCRRCRSGRCQRLRLRR